MKHAVLADDFQSIGAKALELAGGDEAAARRLLALIVETNQATLAVLRDSVEGASWDAVGSTAHRIAGSARMLECSELIALLTRLESAARERDASLATALLPLAVNALESVDRSIGEALRRSLGHGHTANAVLPVSSSIDGSRADYQDVSASAVR